MNHEPKKCDIIIPVWNQLEFTRDCIESLVRNTKYPYRLIVVDNASDGQTRRYLEGLKDRPFLEFNLIRNEKNLGFVKAVNQGLAASDAPYLCVLNNDTIPGPGWLENLVNFAERHPDIGLMNPLCNGHGDKKVEEYAMFVAGNRGRYMEMNQCQGFCMLVKREVLDKIGYLDEAFGMGCYDDTDYSMRAWQAGYRCASVHSSYVYHRENASFNALGRRKIFEKNGEREYLKKWPRHLRIAAAFNMDNSGKNIEEFLRSVLVMAREWCWVNVFIFGDVEAARRVVDDAAKRIGMPRHQNIKFNFLPARFEGPQLLARVLERSFGSKARKRYDLITVDNKNKVFALDALYIFHRAKVISVDFGKNISENIKATIDSMRRTKI